MIEKIIARILREFEEQKKEAQKAQNAQNPAICTWCDGTGVETIFIGTSSISRICPNCHYGEMKK
jgi:hypothetical protein